MNKVSSLFALCICGVLFFSVPHISLAGGSYLENLGDGTCQDRVPGLMWQITPKSRYTKSAEEAKEYVESLSLAGHSDWRLPTEEELSKLIGIIAIQGNGDCEIPKLDKPFWMQTVKGEIAPVRLELDCLCSGDINSSASKIGRVRAVRSIATKHSTKEKL